MAIQSSTNQYVIKGKGPLDAKALVKTYAELLNPNTWLVDGVASAYNGMITAVWLDKDQNGNLTDKNGIYFLHDTTVTNTRGFPNVEIEANWHKLGGIENLPGLADQIAAIQTGLDDLQKDVEDLKDSATEVVELFEQLPKSGVPGKLYIVTEDATTYVWHNGKYLLVGDGADEADIQIIMGGSPTDN